MAAFSTVQWDSPQTVIFFNSHIYSQQDRVRLKETFAKLPVEHHLWFSSSGTGGDPKWIALSFEAFLTSAAAVNTHLKVKAGERWLNCLPHYHVGGQAIYARAYLSTSEVIDISNQKWNPKRYVMELHNASISWTSLVPTQLFDIVENGLVAPDSLKGVIIGGGALSSALSKRGRTLGWPLYVSYGMTEVGSQIATSDLQSESMRLLPHMQARTNSAGFIEIKSKSLMTGFWQRGLWTEPLDWYCSSDIGKVLNDHIEIEGRAMGVKKVRGELVSLSHIQNILLENSDLAESAFTLIFKSDSRDENQVILVSEQDLSMIELERINSLLSPFEKIKRVVKMDSIPRTELGKVLLPPVNLFVNETLGPS